MDKIEISKIIERINQMLIEKNYSLINMLDRKKILTAYEIKKAIEEYGGEISLPDKKEGYEINIYQTKDVDEVGVDFDLWINGIKSDLTLSCNIYKDALGNYQYSIEDIHVL